MEAGTPTPAAGYRGYPGSSVVGASLGTIFFPVISLIAALLLMGKQTDPAKRAGLRMWAWASVAWIGVQVVFVIVVAATFFSSSGVSTPTDRKGPCVGGPAMNAVGKDISGDGTKFVMPCEFSGTVTVTVGSP